MNGSSDYGADYPLMHRLRQIGLAQAGAGEEYSPLIKNRRIFRGTALLERSEVAFGRTPLPCCNLSGALWLRLSTEQKMRSVPLPRH